MFDTELGYTQGMNFVAALILIVVDDDAIAYAVFIKLLYVSEWKRFYIDETPKLFEATSRIKAYISTDLPKVKEHLKLHDIALEPLLASPFITLFSNLIVLP